MLITMLNNGLLLAEFGRPAVRPHVCWHFASHHSTAMFVRLSAPVQMSYGYHNTLLCRVDQKISMRITITVCKLSKAFWQSCTIKFCGVHMTLARWTFEHTLWWEWLFNANCLQCCREAKAASVSTTWKAYNNYKSSLCLVTWPLTFLQALHAMHNCQQQAFS